MYDYISNIDSKTIFINILIILFCIYIFKSKNITLGLVVGVVIALFFVSYINQKKQVEKTTKADRHEFKSDSIRPYKEQFVKYKDLTDFIYSVQDYYYYNPQAFEEMLDYIEHFVTAYDNSITAPRESHKLYDIAQDKKHDALNSLHSIIFNMPSSNATNFKLEKAMDVLEDILNKYMEHLHFITKKDLHETGYNTDYKFVNLGPKADNFYEDKKYTFEIY